MEQSDVDSSREISASFLAGVYSYKTHNASIKHSIFITLILNIQSAVVTPEDSGRIRILYTEGAAPYFSSVWRVRGVRGTRLLWRTEGK